MKILMLSARIGAGHARAAEAITRAVLRLQPDSNVRHLDALEHTSLLYRTSLLPAYGAIVKKFPAVWRTMYERTEAASHTGLMVRFSTAMDRFNARPLAREILASQPDCIVCTHYLPAGVAAALVRNHKLNCPVNVVMTDYAVHTMWMASGVTRYFVATREMAFALRRRNSEPAEIHATGIPIEPVFANASAEKFSARCSLGLDGKSPVVLVACGGLGWGKIDELAVTLAQHFPRVQFLVVAGRNAALLERLKTAASRCDGRIIPYGFVSNMHELMAAADFTVTKCGGMTSSECMAAGLPMIIIEPIPGQEERNSIYLLEQGCALRAQTMNDLIFRIERLIDDRRLLGRMAAAARAAARPLAADEIARIILERAEPARREVAPPVPSLVTCL